MGRKEVEFVLVKHHPLLGTSVEHHHLRPAPTAFTLNLWGWLKNKSQEFLCTLLESDVRILPCFSAVVGPCASKYIFFCYTYYFLCGYKVYLSAVYCSVWIGYRQFLPFLTCKNSFQSLIYKVVCLGICYIVTADICQMPHFFFLQPPSPSKNNKNKNKTLITNKHHQAKQISILIKSRNVCFVLHISPPPFCQDMDNILHHWSFRMMLDRSIDQTS